jgi:hypothetical protein
MKKAHNPHLYPLWFSLIVLILSSISCSFVTDTTVPIASADSRGNDADSVQKSSSPETNVETPLSPTIRMVPQSTSIATPKPTSKTYAPLPTKTRVSSLSQATDAPKPPTEAQYRTVSPNDLAPFFSWGGWGGGGGMVPCSNGQPAVYLNRRTGSINPPNPERGDTIVLGQIILVEGCLFQPGETVTATFILPDGRTEQASAQVPLDPGHAGEWEIPWYSLPDEPLGEYTVEIESPNTGNASLQFHIKQATSPVLIGLCTPSNECLLILTGFQSSEQVMIGQYNSEGKLTYSDFFIMETDGSKEITVPAEDCLYVAIGRQSPLSHEISSYNPEMKMKVSAYDFVTTH